jgi:hypothetical protein
MEWPIRPVARQAVLQALPGKSGAIVDPTCIDFCGSPLENLIVLMIQIPFLMLNFIFELMIGVFSTFTRAIILP